jgi:hypothetical protein
LSEKPAHVRFGASFATTQFQHLTLRPILPLLVFVINGFCESITPYHWDPGFRNGIAFDLCLPYTWMGKRKRMMHALVLCYLTAAETAAVVVAASPAAVAHNSSSSSE